MKLIIEKLTIEGISIHCGEPSLAMGHAETVVDVRPALVVAVKAGSA